MKAELLENSIKEFGFVEIPVVNKDFTIIAGHQRITVERKLHGDDVWIDCRVPNRQLTPKEEKEYNIRSNKNKGDFDMTLMSEFIGADALQEFGFKPMEADGAGEGYEPADDMSLKEHFMQNSIKQIVFNFEGEAFDSAMRRMIEVGKKEGCENMSEVLDKLIAFYEETNLAD
jgi:hypothetical protein